MTDSPSPTPTIAELFDRNPLELSDQDLTLIIAKLREQRAAFQLGQRAPAAAPKTRAALKKLTQVTGEIDLDLL